MITADKAVTTSGSEALDVAWCQVDFREARNAQNFLVSLGVWVAHNLDVAKHADNHLAQIAEENG